MREIQWHCWHTNKMLNSYSHPIYFIANDRAYINICKPSKDLLIMENINLSPKTCHKTIIEQVRLQFRVRLWNELFNCAQIGSLWPNYTKGGYCPPFHQRPVIAAISYFICFYARFRYCWFIFAPNTLESNLEHIFSHHKWIKNWAEN